MNKGSQFEEQVTVISKTQVLTIFTIQVDNIIWRQINKFKYIGTWAQSDGRYITEAKRTDNMKTYIL